MSGLYKNGTYMPLFHHINPQNPIEFNNNGVYPTIPTYDRTIYFLLYSHSLQNPCKKHPQNYH